MPTRTVTSRGQITLGRKVLDHLGAVPGDKIEFELLPQGRLLLHPVRKKVRAARTGRIEDLVGMLAKYTDVKLTIKEMNEAKLRVRP